MKYFLTSKTVLIGILEILIGICGLLIPFFQTAAYTPAAWVALVLGCLTVALRLVTTEPVTLRRQ